MPFLLLLKDGIPQLKLSLGRSTAIGRSSECEIQVPDLKVSRRHALLYIDNSEYCLKDLESENGTFLNGSKINKLVHIKDCDEIQLGDHVFIFNPPFELVHEREGNRSVILVNEDVESSYERGFPAGKDKPLQQDFDSLKTIYDLILNTVLELDPDALLKCLMDRLMDYFSADRGYILEYNKRTNNYKPLVVRSEKQSMALSRVLLNKVIQEKTPLLINNAMEDFSFAGRKSIIKYQLCSVMLVPLMFNDDVTGIIQLDKKVQNSFDKNDLDHFTLISDFAASALNNARKYDHEKKRNITGIKDKKTEFIGSDPAVISLLNTAKKAASSDARVIISGESGTGKELIARLIHDESQRCDEPWISVNCGAIPETLFESEFFGHEKGAFSGAVRQKKGCFELADGGTLFLDEVSEMKPDMQVKLLRALQEGRFYRVGGEHPISVDVRVVSATNRDIKTLVGQGLFREDLYYRLNIISLEVPPLKKRKDDIEILAKYFIEYFCNSNGKKVPVIKPEVFKVLKEYPWPGNVRELQNLIERIAVLNDHDNITVNDLPLEIRSPDLKLTSLPPENDLKNTIETVEKELIISALKKANNKKVDAAKILGISRPTLDKKMEIYNI